MIESQLVRTIRAHIAAGDKAAQKSNDHYIAAGQHLKTLKADHTGSWSEWEALLKEKVRISTGRASELIQIADGRKTVESVRAGKAESMKRLRASSPRGEESAVAPKASTEAPSPRREDCRHAIADSGFDEHGAPIWICRECGLEAARSCGCHPATAIGRAAEPTPPDDGLDIPDCLRREPKAAAS